MSARHATGQGGFSYQNPSWHFDSYSCPLYSAGLDLEEDLVDKLKRCNTLLGMCFRCGDW